VAVLADGLPRSLREPVRALAARPGKGLRPMLLAACAEFGRPVPERLVRAGAVAELLHLASLLHDDMIDRAATRRGGPAAHTVVGRELATLAGVGCFALASQEAAGLGTGAAQLAGRAAAGLAYGEVLDLERAFDTTMTVSAYLELAERKTGELFRLCCLLGAAEAGVRAETAHALAGFGLHLGVAFQTRTTVLTWHQVGQASRAARTICSDCSARRRCVRSPPMMPVSWPPCCSHQVSAPRPCQRCGRWSIATVAWPRRPGWRVSSGLVPRPC
jgi:geranylgeranyl pyrophosphate synthase